MKRPTTIDVASSDNNNNNNNNNNNRNQVARLLSHDEYSNISVRGVSIDVSRFLERTYRLWTILCHQKVKMRESDTWNFSIHEATLLWNGMTGFTYVMFHFLYNKVCRTATLVDVDTQDARYNATIIVHPPPLVRAATCYTQDSIDLLWLSPTVFISTHLYQFPSPISSFPLYMIQLISRDSSADTTILIYTVHTDSDINNNDNDNNHPHLSTPALSVVCEFLQRLLVSVPIDYFSQIKLWQQTSCLPSMAELRTFLSVVPPSAALFGQPVLSDRMDEITSFRLGGECDIFVFRDLANMTMNHNVRLDLWSMHFPREQLEEANAILREMPNIPHITVPMGLNDFNSKDKSFTSNNNLQSITVSLIDPDLISTTMLNGIKNNPQIMTFRLNMCGKKMQQNIQRLCCHALDGNTSLPRLVVYYDDDEEDDDDEDDDRESIENANNSSNSINNNWVTPPIHPIDMLITELVASCKNGWSMQYILVSNSSGKLRTSNKVWDQLVAPILCLNRFYHDTSRSDSSMMSLAHLPPTISRVNNGNLLRKVSSQSVNKSIPSNASVIYNLLRSHVAVYTL
jgi:hypothetical protein